LPAVSIPVVASSIYITASGENPINTESHQESKRGHDVEESPLPPSLPNNDSGTAGTSYIRHRWISWWSIAWRFTLALVFSLLLIAVLYGYSRSERLGTWDRRAFNTLTILFSSLASLSLGSLLGLLGAALRWPILARRVYTPRKVDLILGMYHPLGSLKLIAYQSRHRKLSVTTLIVLLYLIFNVVVRLSVAVFGLTYDLNDDLETEYPTMATDFGSVESFQYNPSEHLDYMIETKDFPRLYFLAQGV
jgi:hypothetical protein